MYLAGATEAVSLALKNFLIGPSWSDWPLVLFMAAYAGFILILIWLTAYKGRNGVRWYFLGIFFMHIWDADSLARQEYYRDEYLAAGFLDFTALALGALAFYFVFTGDAAPWFRRPGQIFY